MHFVKTLTIAGDCFDGSQRRTPKIENTIPKNKLTSLKLHLINSFMQWQHYSQTSVHW